jgi:hypothetical protein
MPLPKPRTYVCDWAEYQGNLSPQQVADEGYGGLWLQGGGSDHRDPLYVDPFFLPNAKRVAASGIDTKQVVVGSYWYLAPGPILAQIGRWMDVLFEARGKVAGWMLELDVEHPGLTYLDVQRASFAVMELTDAYPMFVYTRHTYWTGKSFGSGWAISELLHDTKWLPESVRQDPAQPYLSQQARAMPDDPWSAQYGDWTQAQMVQVTNRNLVDHVRTMGSLFHGTTNDLRQRATRG